MCRWHGRGRHGMWDIGWRGWDEKGWIMMMMMMGVACMFPVYSKLEGLLSLC